MSRRDPDDEPEYEEPVAVTAALDRVLRSLRGGAGRREVGGVFGRWEEAVGPAVAAHVRPVRLERGTLLVEVDDPAWATQVRFLADDVRRRLFDGRRCHASSGSRSGSPDPEVPPADDTPLVD